MPKAYRNPRRPTKIKFRKDTKIKKEEDPFPPEPDPEPDPEPNLETDSNQSKIDPDEPKSGIFNQTTQQDLYELMESLFPIKRTDDSQEKHEILEALERDSITDFEEFTTMSEIDISRMTKSIKGNAVPLSNMSIRRLSSLSRLISFSQEKELEDSDLPSSYTKEMLSLFMKAENKQKLGNTAYTVATSPTPAFGSTPTKSPWREEI